MQPNPTSEYTMPGANSDSVAPESSSLMLKFRALRVHQWVKNFLLFVPLFLGHDVASFTLASQVLLGFVAFCLTASSVYLLNDIVDLESDRAHPTKKNRPFASGAIPTSWGWRMIPFLLVCAVVLGLAVSSRFLIVLGVYYLTTIAYTFSLKQKPLIDVVVLAMLYTIRIIAGTEAAMQHYSFWLLSYSLFLFLSLAFVKRYSELYNMKSTSEGRKKTRGYEVQDMQMLGTLGATSGNLSVLVLALYINSPEVRILYHRPEFLWAICPIVLFWIGRIWLLTSRGLMHEDPIVFALKDRSSYMVGALAAFVAVLASW